MFPIGAMI